jgi:tetratricopeptide (TPR) repeat protein
MSGDLEGLHACSASGEEKLTAEGELAVARLVMDGGDLPHAATHLGNALAAAPALPEVFECLAELATRAGGPARAAELFGGERPYIGAVGCRAHLLAAAERWDPAVETLAAVLSLEPGRPWALVPWLARTDLAALVSAGAVAGALARLLGGDLPEPLPEPLTATVRPFFDLVTASVARHPHDPALLSRASALARRFAAHDLAITWAGHAHEVEPDHTSAIMLGYALRGADRADDALAVWEAEADRDPSDLSLYVDIAELYAGTGRAALGLPWLERALAADPDHPVAGPALHGVRHTLDGDRRHLLALADHLRDHPDHAYAWQLLERHSEGLPWLTGVTAGRESIVNAMRQMAENGSTADSAIQLACSGLEAPSAVLAVRQVFPRAEIRFLTVPEPDPRLPLDDGVRTVVWRYGNDNGPVDSADSPDRIAVPAVAAPAESAVTAVRSCAALGWGSLPTVYDHAVRLATVPVEDLLGILAHPPAPRSDKQGRLLAARYPDLWIRTVQAFACLGIAHHGTDQPWQGSRRRRVLADLLRGPEDWVTEAAGFALLAVAWSDPATREDVGMLLVERLLGGAEALRTRPVEVLPALCHFVLACTWLDDTFTSMAADLLKMLERADEEEPDPGEVDQKGRELLAQAGMDADSVTLPPRPGAARPAPERPARKGLLGRLRRRR